MEYSSTEGLEWNKPNLSFFPWKLLCYIIKVGIQDFRYKVRCYKHMEKEIDAQCFFIFLPNFNAFIEFLLLFRNLIMAYPV